MHNKLIAVFVGLILLLGVGMAGAGESKAGSQPAKIQKPTLPNVIKKSGNTDEYVLVMSKDDNVCQHMLKIYNEDLRKYGRVNYDRHMEFNKIAWINKKYFFMKDGRKQYPMTPPEPGNVLMSRFDITVVS